MEPSSFLLGFLILLIIAVVIILTYQKLRPLFPVKVNCWFCDQDTQVPFGNRNCWDCPHCEQYNGFNPDGDYNKPVPAQYTEEINHPVSCEPVEFLSRSQFLCHRCQRNQLLQVKQLAAFEPLNESTYDGELSFYKRHLEEVYALCPSCNSIVKRELERQDESLSLQKDTVSKDVPWANDSCVEAEPTSVLQKILPARPLLPWVVSAATSVCTVMLVGLGGEHYRPEGKRFWLTGGETDRVDRLGIGLCGLVLCMLSKLFYGKDRLHVCDAVHITVWVGVVLAGLLLPVPWLDLSLPVLLFTLELFLFFTHRQPSNVTTPIMKRLSLEGGGSGACNDAVSEAVSSVSTSCRQRLMSPFLDGGDGPGVSVLNSFNSEKSSPSGLAHGVLARETRATGKKNGDLEDLGKGMGAILIGPHSSRPHSSESGYSSGKSSVFSSKAFGPASPPSFNTGVSFPRPLLLPARLSVVSFSQQNQSSLWSQRSPLFDSMKEHSPGQGRGHVNPFLLQGSRPLSMFPSKRDRLPTSNLSDFMTKRQPPSRSSALFWAADTPKTMFHTKAASEVDFPIHLPKTKHSKAATTTWWRSSASDIVENRHDQPLPCLNKRKDVQSQDIDSSDNKSQDKKTAVVVPNKPPSTVECDSTTPLLSQLSISALSKKRKKKSGKQRVKEVADTFIFSDDEEEEEPLPLPSPSTVSTVVLQTKQDWGWLQWLSVGVMVVSVVINFFLAWTVWASR